MTNLHAVMRDVLLERLGEEAAAEWDRLVAVEGLGGSAVELAREGAFGHDFMRAEDAPSLFGIAPCLPDCDCTVCSLEQLLDGNPAPPRVDDGA